MSQKLSVEFVIENFNDENEEGETLIKIMDALEAQGFDLKFILDPLSIDSEIYKLMITIPQKIA
jgi:hypothetical protein